VSKIVYFCAGLKTRIQLFFHINIEKVMKNMKFSLIAAFAIALAVSFTGCTDPCKDVTCVNGECVEGDCACDTGYEGADCGTALNAKFAGTYSNSPETCTPSGPVAAPYSVTITSSGTVPTNISITGLWEEPAAIATATVASNGTDITIERQNFAGSAWEISGTGTMNADGTVLTIDYTIFDATNGDVLDNCDATLTKQ
jgi:hypothetical protein